MLLTLIASIVALIANAVDFVLSNHAARIPPQYQGAEPFVEEQKLGWHLSAEWMRQRKAAPYVNGANVCKGVAIAATALALAGPFLS